ncbi:hypothetical protein, partial [Dokdonella sp.]|uniref:hypothetical protein n=1 Tax=Dokdonella sp. TaxID=2291710 RepID=UPI003C72CBD6
DLVAADPAQAKLLLDGFRHDAFAGTRQTHRRDHEWSWRQLAAKWKCITAWRKSRGNNRTVFDRHAWAPSKSVHMGDEETA